MPLGKWFERICFTKEYKIKILYGDFYFESENKKKVIDVHIHRFVQFFLILPSKVYTVAMKIVYKPFDLRVLDTHSKRVSGKYFTW